MASKRKKKKQNVLQRFFSGIFPDRKSWSGEPYYDYNLLACVILLVSFGLVMLYSTSAYTAKVNYGSDMTFFAKQAGLSAVCILGMLFISRVEYHWIANWGAWLYHISNILLILTRFVGRNVKGATRWIRIGPVQFQTAEIAKLAIILFLPSVIVKLGRNIKGWKAPAMLVFLGAITSVLTWKFTNNLSSAMIIAGMTLVLVIVAHPWGTKIALFGGIAAVPAVLIIRSVAVQIAQSSDSFRWQRIRAWLNPESESSGTGYQIMQGLYALGSGGLFGKGLGNSAQKLGAVPEAQNDMIFTIVCEELGVFGAALLTMLFVFLLYRLFFIAQNASDLLGSLIVTGIFAQVALQVILNIAVVLNVIPATGITLPFISYGGTSIVFLMMEMGIALSVADKIRLKDEYTI